MDPEKIKKLRSIKILVSEVLMVFIVIITVIILALIVSGYWVNSEFEVERQGMLQVSSVPTGANVMIDGETSWLQRTNTSKVLATGEHSVTLTKEGYDSWSKTVNIAEGLLYRLHYPRLFLEDRVIEKSYYLPETTFATISPGSELLLITNNTTNWQLINLTEENLKPRSIDISNVFQSVSLTPGSTIGLFTGSIIDADWDHDETRVLFKVQNDTQIEWVLLDVREPQNSINVTREFGSNFSNIQILDNSANNLLAIQNGNLHKIDVSGKSLSAVIVERIVDYDHYENEIVYVSQQPESELTPMYEVGLTKIGDNNKTTVFHIAQPVKVALLKFYDQKYISVLKDNHLTLYNKDNIEETTEYTISFNPANMKVGHDGEFIILSESNHLATIDMEAAKAIEWQIENVNYDWLDNDMFYDVSEGDLIVYDYDGLNRRNLAKNVSNHFPVTITDNKWLYYFSDDYLVREWLIKR
ncbi:PEGA domain-containing protein [Candidatus Saccharibacteria bacterium]|nr:PEGA domain-containing protein [Candidatus Saccharibacteria bacterium]